MKPVDDFDVYKTAKAISEGIFKDRGSKFIALVFPVFSEEEIKNILKELKKKYFDATHHCYAFRLGADKKNFRASDDGEPGGSAGLPILHAIQSNDLSNILIVVIRYYGGTKLGVPGLIHAYRTAANDAISNGQITEFTEKEEITIQYPYLSMNSIMKIIKDHELHILSQNFDSDCQITLSVRKRDFKLIREKIIDINGAEIK